MSEPLSSDVRRIVLEALETRRESDVPAAGYVLKLLDQAASRYWVVRATAPGDDAVYRILLPGAAKQSPSAANGRFPPEIKGAHIAPQTIETVGRYRVVRRPYVPKLFTVHKLVRETGRFGNDRAAAALKVRSFVEQFLQGLISIHSKGKVHGDLRPTKIGLMGDGLLVIRDIGVQFGAANLKEPEYVAPEILRGDAQRANASTDIFAFLRISRLLLSPFHGDTTLKDIAELDSQIRWLQDYYYPVGERPSASALLNFLQTRESPAATSLDTFFDAYNEAARRRLHKGSAASSHLRNVGHLLAEYPETGFAIDGSMRAQKLATWLALANEQALPDNNSHSNRKMKGNAFLRTNQIETMEFERSDIQPSIDDVWRNNLHRLVFGFPIDPDHDRRMQNLSPDQLGEQAMFESAVQSANDARSALLDENPFLSTKECLELFRNGDAPLDREQFLVLRRWGYVLTVPDHGRCLYPSFQFREGIVTPIIHDVHMSLLRKRKTQEINPWVELTYWCVKRDALGGLALRDVVWQERYRHQINRVIEKAVL